MEVSPLNVGNATTQPLTVNMCPIAFNAMKTQVRRIPFMVAFKGTMGEDF